MFKARGTDARTNHDVRSTGCTARINVTLVKDKEDEYKVKINKHDSTHNHRVDERSARYYPEAGKVTCPETLGVVSTLWQGTLEHELRECRRFDS